MTAIKRRYHKNTITPIGATEPHVRALFQHLDAQNITLRDAEDRSGVTGLDKWRAGKHSPTLHLFAAVCDSVGVLITLTNRAKRGNVDADQLDMFKG